MKIVSEFKAFLMKGEIVSLATAVIVGGAFGKIVSSFTNDVLMPPIGLLLGKVNFSELSITLVDTVKNEAGEITQAAVAIQYGNFIQTIVDFVIIGACIFLVLKAYQKTQKQEEKPPAPKGPSELDLLVEIRDLLKK
mgnify:FL=1